MPDPAGVARRNITATIAGGEQMVHTFHWRIDPTTPPSTSATLQTLADKIRDRWIFFIGDSQSAAPSTYLMFASSTVYNTVDTYLLGPDGRAQDQAQAAFVDTNTGGGTAAMPTEVAVCATLLTGAPGRRARGRVYLGGLSQAALAGDGRVVAQGTQNLATGLARFFSEMDSDASGVLGFNALVLSRVGGSVRVVTDVAVGDVFDVQRRRRNKLRETRRSAEVDS